MTLALIHVQMSGDWSGVVLGATNIITQRHSEGCCLDTVRFNECCYYLRMYGSPSAMVTFLVKHNCFREACSFLLENVSSMRMLTSGW